MSHPIYEYLISEVIIDLSHPLVITRNLTSSLQHKFGKMASTSIFFTIPLEIRRKIYRLLLAGPHTILNSFSLIRAIPVWTGSIPVHDVQDHFWFFEPEFAILAVSRQVYGEASSVLYEDSWFGAYCRITEVFRLLKVQHLDLGGPTVELHQVRRLILNFHDESYEAPWSRTLANGIKTALELYASHTASLTYLGINLCFGRGYWLDEHQMLSKTLEDPDLMHVLQYFTVRNEISIRLVQDGLTLADSVEQWALSIAEQEDLFIYKHQVRHLLSGLTVHGSVVWSVVSGGRMPLAAWNFSVDMTHLPVAGRTVDSTEKVVHLNTRNEYTRRDASWGSGDEEDEDGHDEEQYDDNDDEQDVGDDGNGDGENSEKEEGDDDALADGAEEDQ